MIEFAIDYTVAPVMTKCASKDGEWDVLVLANGYLFTRWAIDLTSEYKDWHPVTTTFVPREK